MRVVGLDHVVFVVSDIEASVRWYQELLGVEVERLDDWRAGDAPFVSLRLDAGTVLDLFAGAEVPGTGIDHIALVVDGVDLAELTTRSDVSFEGPPATLWGAKGYGQGVYLRDPDGNLVELRTYNT